MEIIRLNISCLFLLLVQCLYAQSSFHIEPLDEGIYVHYSFDSTTIVRENGIILESDDGLIVIHLPVNDVAGETLLSWSEEVLQKPILMAYIVEQNTPAEVIDKYVQSGVFVATWPELKDKLQNDAKDLVSQLNPGSFKMAGEQFTFVQYGTDRILCTLASNTLLYSHSLFAGLGDQQILQKEQLARIAELEKIQLDYTEVRYIIPRYGMFGDMPTIISEQIKILNQ